MSIENRRLYKYAGPNQIANIFGPTSTTLKCSRPKDFNDPFELFLTIDFKDEPDALAFYADVIGELPQSPTTCFSRSPIVLPMWAHYAQNHEGFAIEFDDEKIAKAFPDGRLNDVRYSDAPDPDLSEMLHSAYKIGKMRYTYFAVRRFQCCLFYEGPLCS